MGIVWSAKGSKDPPLVSADEFLILDSEDATLSTKNKLVTLATVQANLVTSVDANDFNITKLNSISINDSANDNTFTISSSFNLTGDRTINLPFLAADDTFALLGLINTFSETNIFQQNIEIRSDLTCASLFTTVASNTGLGGRIVGQFSRGTTASRLAVQNGDRLYTLLAAGFDGTVFDNAAFLIWNADGNWTGTNHGSILTFTTTPTNTTTPETNILIKNRVVSFEDNDLDNIKSIKLNDASDTNKFTILGAELTTDRTATIPPLSADDTFAMLGVDNTFTGENTWTDDLVQLEDNTSQNANFTGEVFSTSTVEKTGFQGFRAAGTKAIPAATTSGSVFVDLDAVGFDGTNFSIGGSAGFDTPATWSGTSTPVRFSIFTTNIDSTTNVENFVIDADGTADFKGNNITNAVIQSNLTDGSILVGNESNVSKDFPAKLQTKADCDVATTVSGDLATSFEAGDMIDTVTLDVGDRILIKDQATATENGIYTVNSSGPPTRADDANEDSEVNNGMFTKIIDGSANINTAFVLSTPDNITLGVTDLTFDEFSFSDIAHLNSSQTYTGLNKYNRTIVLESLDSTQGVVFSTMFTNAAFIGPGFIGFKARGTKSSPLAVVDGTFLVEMQGGGFDGTTFPGTFGFVCIAAAGTWNSAPVNRPTKVLIATATAGPSPSVIDRIIVGSEGETSFQDNTIQNIKSIKLNDFDDTHSYTILGGDLSTDLNVTIPDITANDTFAMLNVQNEFTQRQIITLPISTVVDGLSVGNADGQLVLGNNTADVGEFAPLISLTSKGSDNPSTIQALIAAADDTGTTPASVINVQRPGGFAITTRPLWEIQNNGSTQVSVAADGDWDFKGNAISDIGTLDYTDAIATIVTGVLTTTVTYQSVAGEAAAADDLVTITAGTTGQYLIIRPSDGAVTITVKNTGNIVTIGGNDFVMDDIEDTMTLIYDGTNWIEISRNAAPSSKRQIFLYHSSNTNLDSILLGAGSLSTTGNSNAFLDADGYYVNYGEGGMGAQPDIICTDVSRRNHNFDLTIKFRAPASVDRRLWFGFFTANPEGTDTPTTDHIGVRLSTDAGDTGFVLSHAGGGTQAEIALAVSDTAIHTIRIVADAANNKFSFSFDGGTLTDVTTNIPAAAENLDFYSIATKLGVPASQFDFWFLDGFADV